MMGTFGKPFVLCLLLLLVACAEPATEATVSDAREGARDPAPGTISDTAGEQLLAQAPEGWQQILAIDRPGLRMAEFVPAADDEPGEDWTQKISFESLAGTPLPDPIEFVNGLSTDQEGTCEGFEAFSTFSGLENGYPTTVHMLICHRSILLDNSQVTMIKAIQGNEKFYIVTRSQRAPALAEGANPISETEIAGWSLYLKAISVCDTSSDSHPCP